MSQPQHHAGSQPTPSGQSKTLFVQEGNPACVMVTNKGGKMSQKTLRFATSLAAFEWCRSGGVGMVYSPALVAGSDPSLN